MKDIMSVASFWVFVVAVVVIIIIIIVVVVVIIIVGVVVIIIITIIIIIISSFFTRQSRILGQQGKGKATCNSSVPLLPASQTPRL